MFQSHAASFATDAGAGRTGLNSIGVLPSGSREVAEADGGDARLPQGSPAHLQSERRLAPRVRQSPLQCCQYGEGFINVADAIKGAALCGCLGV